MKDCCEGIENSKRDGKSFYRVLWIALIVNFLMFIAEIFFSMKSRSLSLSADAVDFFGDSVNYASSLFVFGSILRTKARLSMFKGMFMLLYSLTILGVALYRLYSGEVPSSETMGLIGGVALAANAFVAVLLYSFRDGDSNMQSVWICTRNDVVGNLAVVLAAVGVYWTGTRFPDLIVALLMAILSYQGAKTIFKVARNELRGEL